MICQEGRKGRQPEDQEGRKGSENRQIRRFNDRKDYTMYRPARRQKEPKKEKEGKKGLTREENIALFNDMLYGIGAREGPEGERIVEKAREIQTADDLQLLYIDYIEHLRDQAGRGVDIIPDIEGFCSFAGISRRKYRELEGKNDFSALISRISTSIAATQKQYGMRGIIPPLVLAMNFNNNFDYLSNVSTLEIRQNAQNDCLPSKSDILASLPIDQDQTKEPEE